MVTMLEIGTENMGYRVYAIKPKDDHYVVAAASQRAVQQYVTWEATAEPLAFYWGHYFGTIDAAHDDLNDRAYR